MSNKGVQLTQKEADAVGTVARQGITVETLKGIIKRATTFHSSSERSKSSDIVKAGLQIFFSGYMSRPAYVDKENQIHVLIIGGNFIPVSISIDLGLTKET